MEVEKFYDILDHYKNVLEKKHYENTIKYFDDLVEKEKIDVAQNKITVDKINNLTSSIKQNTKILKNNKIGRGFNFFFMILSFFISAIFLTDVIYKATEKGNLIRAVDLKISSVIFSLLFLLGIGFVIIYFLVIRRIIKKYVDILYNLENEKKKNIDKGYDELKKLNSGYDRKISEKLVMGVFPQLKFDDDFKSCEYEAYKKHFNYNYKKPNTSIIDLKSGKLLGKPVLFFTEKQMKMGTAKYTGHLTISWQVLRTVNGQVYYDTKTQVLTATVEKPKPFYYEYERLTFLTDSVPKLSFDREVSGVNQLSDKQLDKKIKKDSKLLDKLEKKEVSTGGDFTKMENDEFESIFGAINRDDEVGFRQLFTPLAQKEILKLLKDKEVGYGDIYDISKRKKVVNVYAFFDEHFDYQSSIKRYKDYSLDSAKEKFISYNYYFFKRIYFRLALIMAIPEFQNKDISELPEICDIDYLFPPEQEEEIANLLWEKDRTKFDNPKTATEAIIKTKLISSGDDWQIVNVKSNTFETINRTEYVPVYGGDGTTHMVPVIWVEYIPIENDSEIIIKKIEDENIKRNDIINLMDKQDDYLRSSILSNGLLGVLKCGIISDDVISKIKDFKQVVKEDNPDCIIDNILDDITEPK